MTRLSMETVSNRLVLTNCVACAIQFAVPEGWDENRRETGNTFYCPNGHTLTYKSEIDRLRKQLEEQRTRLLAANDQRVAAERQVTAMRGQMTKLRKRAENGVCPCCHRTFVQLARHMKAKHPGYADEK